MSPDENDIIYDSYGPDLLGIVNRIIDATSGTPGTGGNFFSDVAMLASDIWRVYSIFAFIISGVLIIGIIYAFIRFNQLSEVESNQLLEAQQLWRQLHGQGGGHSGWQKIRAYVESDNPNDWKQGIIEADSMLDKLLIEKGYAGLTLGERLKSASPTQFTTIRDAWDAHMVRNKIAHQGSDFILTHKIARDTMLKYGKVFSEFGVT